jgi:hypothetical protein
MGYLNLRGNAMCVGRDSKGRRQRRYLRQDGSVNDMNARKRCKTPQPVSLKRPRIASHRENAATVIASTGQIHLKPEFKRDGLKAFPLLKQPPRHSAADIQSLSIRMSSQLHPGAFRMIRYVKSKGIRVMFSTNATLLDAGMADAIMDAQVDLIIFSVNGATPEAYRAVHGYDGYGRGSSKYSTIPCPQV